MKSWGRGRGREPRPFRSFREGKLQVRSLLLIHHFIFLQLFVYARAPLKSITFHSPPYLSLGITAMPRSQTLALSPSNQSPVRHSPQRTMPTRTRQQLNNVPGIINLPMSTKLNDSYPSSNSSSQSPSRHTSPPQSLPLKPVASLDQALLGQQQDENKKRRRQKKSNPVVVPLEEVASQSVKGRLSPNPVSPSRVHVDENGVDQSTPTKARRRRGRANRQTSPPLPEILSKESGFSSTTPPLADSHAHSQSVPPELPPRHHHHHHHYSHQSSEDEWDMPSIGGGGGGKRASAVKESLSWQQELLKTTSTSVAPTRNNRTRNENKVFESSPNSRPSPRQTRNSVPTPHRHAPNNKPRPVLHPSLSDTNPSSNPCLNWQQEMLLQTDLQTSALSENRRTHSSSPTKPSPVTVTHTAPSSTMTPARQRQQRIKDSITFGLNDLDLSDDAHSAEDIFNSPISRHNSMNRRTHQNQGMRRQSPPTNTEFATPTKSDSLEPRYAGPTFHNSPAPSSLPVPSFVLRRQT